MFTAPQLSSSARVIWSAVAILVYGLGMSYFNAWQLMMYNITPNENERNNLITTAKFFEIFGDFIPSLTPIFVTILPKISNKFTMEGIYSGFAYFIFAMASCFAIFGFFNMRERIPLQTRDHMQLFFQMISHPHPSKFQHFDR